MSIPSSTLEYPRAEGRPQRAAAAVRLAHLEYPRRLGVPLEYPTVLVEYPYSTPLKTPSVFLEYPWSSGGPRDSHNVSRTYAPDPRMEARNLQTVARVDCPNMRSPRVSVERPYSTRDVTVGANGGRPTPIRLAHIHLP